jgi:hypothetical protein
MGENILIGMELLNGGRIMILRPTKRDLGDEFERILRDACGDCGRAKSLRRCGRSVRCNSDGRRTCTIA